MTMTAFSLDEVDKRIIAMLLKHPYATHLDIAVVAKISQPTVGARIKKMEKKGIVRRMYGIDLAQVEGTIIKIEAKCRDADELISELRLQKGFSGAFKCSGEYNLLAFFCVKNEKEADWLVNAFFRSRSNAITVKLEFVRAIENNMALSLTM